MTVFDAAIIALSSPIIAVLCYGTYRFMQDQDHNPAPVRNRREAPKR